MSLLSKDPTPFRRNRKLQLDGQQRPKHVTRTVNSHGRPVTPRPDLEVADTPEYGYQHDG